MVMEWKQAGDDGDLVYNQGAVVASSDTDGAKTRVLVVGIHIIEARTAGAVDREGDSQILCENPLRQFH